MIIEQIKQELENLEELEFKKVNKQQRQMLRENYNFYTTGFEYAEDDYENIIFICAKDTFRNMEYYLGLEYEREEIEYKFEFENKIIVSYSGSDRAENLLVKLKELEDISE